MDRLSKSLRKCAISSPPVIVDIQCFKDDQNEYILKEVCVLEAESGILLMHHIVKPPYDRAELSDEKLRESYWLTKYCHGLQWDQGDIPFYKLLCKLTDCLANRSIVYVKGREKKEYIKRNHVTHYNTTNVIDVTAIGCGSIDSINNLMSTNILRCCNHKSSSTDTRCALTNCVAIRGWLLLTTRVSEDETKDSTSAAAAASDSETCFCSCFRSTSTTADGYTCCVGATEGYDTVE